MARRSPADEPALEFRILGPLEAIAGGRAIDLGSPKQRDLLAVLLIDGGRVVSTARLADEIWHGEPPDRPEPTLQAYVSRLRKVLGAHRLVTRAPGYALDVRPDDIDAARFERLLTSGRDARLAGDAERAVALLREALSLWRGRALDGVRVLAAEQEASRLEALRIECIDERIDAELATGAGAELVAELQALLAAEPLRERTAGQLATALYRAGRQSDALDVVQAIADQLREQLGVDPSPALRELQGAILRQEPVLEHRAPAAGLRAETSSAHAFVGRTNELAQTAALLDEPGLVTLTGLGGTGKTRIAMAIAESRSDVDGVVRLAPLRDGDLVFRTIASALGIDEAPGRRIDDLVIDRLAPSDGLLVLDNCEHLAGPVSDTVLAIRAASPDLRILATSREPLGVSRERVWTVPPMQPQDAKTLFAERAALANPGVTLPFDGVERICARVGGMPLAVELAAARTRVLTVEQIADRLADVVRTIDPDERLSSALSWAVDELDRSDQDVFDRLSVFAGSFTVEDAERVCPAGAVTETSILPGLVRLVEMSLLVAEPDGDSMRYRMLEPVRQYGARRTSEDDDLAARHFAWASAIAKDDDDDAVDAILDDVRAALGWALVAGNDPSGGLELACALSGYWRVHGYIEEGLRWLGAAITAAPADDPNIRVAHRRCSELASQISYLDEAVTHAKTAIALAEAAGDDHTLAWATMNLAVALHLTESDASYELYDRAIDAARRVGDEMLEMQILHNTATMLSEGGDNPSAKTRFEQALEIAQRRDDAEAIVIITQCLARLAIDRRDLDEARVLADASVALARRARVAVGITHGLFVLGQIAYIDGDYARAHAYFDEQVEAERRAGNRLGEVDALICVAGTQQMRGMVADALRTAHEARVVARELDMPRAIAQVDQELAELYLELGDLGRAALHIGDALRADDPMSARRWWARARDAAVVIAQAGEHDDAVTVLGAMDALLRADDRPPVEEFDPGLPDVLARAREAVGSRFDEIWEQGCAMSREETTAFALDALRRTFSGAKR
jgi:predicted ATPase/DNA-binding SARP family transcriptional activator